MADEISLPVHLLETILDATLTALYFSQTFDLADSYRQLESEPKGSPLSRDLAQAVIILESYVKAEEPESKIEKDNEDVSTPK